MTDYDISLGIGGSVENITPALCGGRQFGRRFNKKDYPLYTFCPDWIAPIHPEGLYEGKVDIETIIDDETNVHDFIEGV